jgi:hypothetical protein
VLTATFFLLSAFFHILNCTLLREYYLRELSYCRSPTRWIEYSLSAPLMFVLIAYGLGIRSRAELLTTAVLIGVTMPFGYWVEREGRPASADAWEQPFATRIFPWGVGHLPQIAAWVVVIVSFYDNGWDIDRVPAFVHAILWGELALFFSFGAASLLSQWSTPRYFYRGELAFQVLSLVSKGVLGMLLVVNVLMLSRFDDIYEGM